MSIWNDLVSNYKNSDLSVIFSNLGVLDVETSDYSTLKVASLAQWTLESGRGTSVLATKHFNFAGLKWRDEMKNFATKVHYIDSVGEPDYYCKFTSLENFIIGYWKFITRSPYTGWQDYISSPQDYIGFLKSKGYAGDPDYITKVVKLFPEARQLLNLSPEEEIGPIGTWIKETDEAIYWMRGKYYIEKADKVDNDNNNEFDVVITKLKEWFSGDEYPIPRTMKIGQGDVPEPAPIKRHGHGSDGDQEETRQKPRQPSMKFDSAHTSNFTSGRSGQSIDTIMVHNTVGSFQSAVNWFKNSTSNVSAHYVISRQGEIKQMVEDEHTAWHAGNSDINRRSIGIEHEATEAQKGFTTAMENASIALIKYLMHEYNVSVDRVLPHRIDWGGAHNTSCPNLLWPNQKDFNVWKDQNLENTQRQGLGGDSVKTSVQILRPSNGDEFNINQSFTIEGTADDGVKSVNVYTPWGGTNWALGTSIPVVDGKWSLTVSTGFNTGGQREILAEGNGVNDNSLDFYPDEVRILIGTGMTKPTRGDRISSHFGWRNGRMHKGIDIAANRGVPVFAVADGVVTVAKTGCRKGNQSCGGGFGNHIFIKHSALSLETVYAHLTTVLISNAQTVTRGQQIGTIGSTGGSTGPHLHFEIRENGIPKNPLDFINPIV